MGCNTKQIDTKQYRYKIDAHLERNHVLKAVIDCAHRKLNLFIMAKFDTAIIALLVVQYLYQKNMVSSLFSSYIHRQGYYMDGVL